MRQGAFDAASPYRRYAIALVLAFLGSALFVTTFLMPWWTIHLQAPQYPLGLDLRLYLHDVRGDVAEVDTLNHYIGMAPIELAAQKERQLSPLFVAGFALASFFLAGLVRSPLRWLALVVALALPVAFVVDSEYWLYHYGHHLDPRAPLEIHAFTPQLFGPGTIGQFHTHASPAIGFYLALVACGLLVAALMERGASTGRPA